MERERRGGQEQRGRWMGRKGDGGTAGGKPRPSTPSGTQRRYKEFHPVPGPHRLIHQRQESNPGSPVYIGPGKRPYHWANP
ncbi:unnamed protein product [Prunus armeniaca]